MIYFRVGSCISRGGHIFYRGIRYFSGESDILGWDHILQAEVIYFREGSGISVANQIF